VELLAEIFVLAVKETRFVWVSERTFSKGLFHFSLFGYLAS
jgi:hypothetical protein